MKLNPSVKVRINGHADERGSDQYNDDLGQSRAAAVREQLESQGWGFVEASAPEFGQAEASATVFLEEEGAFAPGEFQVTNVFEVNPPAESAWPKLGPNGEFDQLNNEIIREASK